MTFDINGILVFLGKVSGRPNMKFPYLCLKYAGQPSHIRWTNEHT